MQPNMGNIDTTCHHYTAYQCGTIIIATLSIFDGEDYIMHTT